MGQSIKWVSQYSGTVSTVGQSEYSGQSEYGALRCYSVLETVSTSWFSRQATITMCPGAVCSAMGEGFPIVTLWVELDSPYTFCSGDQVWPSAYEQSVGRVDVSAG